MHNPTVTNPFSIIKDMDTKIAELAMSAIGGTCIFQAAFEIAIAMDLESREAIEERLGARTNDSRSEEDAFEEGNDRSNDVAEEQGRLKKLDAAAHRRRAKNLIDIHTYCCEEIRSGTTDEFAQPQSMIGVITFLCRGEPRKYSGDKQRKVQELIAKGVVTAERIAQRQSASAERQAKSWAELADAVYDEYQALQGTTVEHHDSGASGASQESLGEHAFNQLDAEMGERVWERFLNSFASKFENFTMRVVDGFEREVKFNELDKFVLLYGEAAEACKQARIRFYKTHRAELNESAGPALGSPPRATSGGVAAATVEGKIATGEMPARTTSQVVEDRLIRKAAAHPLKHNLPII